MSYSVFYDTAMIPALERSYRDTTYWIEYARGEFGLRIGEPCPALEALLREHGVVVWTYVTAWNPASRRLDPDDNAQRHALLMARLTEEGYSTVPGYSVADQGDWPPEEGVLVLGMNASIALDIGAEFGQNAIVAGTLDGKPRLLWCESEGEAPTSSSVTEKSEHARIDRWLWTARFFKTRALAQAAVVAGRARLNGERVKPAKEIAVGDEVAVRVGEFEWTVMVRGIARTRGSAPVAATLYEEHEASRARRLAQLVQRKVRDVPESARRGRPTKRERRQIIRFRQKDDF